MLQEEQPPRHDGRPEEPEAGPRPLGRDPELYGAYVQKIREEYSFLTTEDFLSSRAGVLARLLETRIFNTSIMSAKYEERARVDGLLPDMVAVQPPLHNSEECVERGDRRDEEHPLPVAEEIDVVPMSDEQLDPWH